MVPSSATQNSGVKIMLSKFNLKSTPTLNQQRFIVDSLVACFGDIKINFNKHNLICDTSASIQKEDFESAVKRLLFIARGIDGEKVIYEQDADLNFNSDPLDALKESRQVVDLGSGLFQFQGDFLKVFRAVDRYFLSLALEDYNATEQENPSLWPVELFRTVNYLNEFPQQAMLTAGLIDDHKVLKEFSEEFSNEKEYSAIALDERFEEARFGLQPAVCDHCYLGLQNLENVKNTVITTCNKVFRNEESKNNSLDRLRCFTVRDIVFIGEKEFVLETRQLLIQSLKKFFKNTGLCMSIEVADDPFFTNNFEKKMFQHAFELKYEVLARVPFLEKNIAVGSVNLHLDTFGKSFNISSKGEKVYSGCIGIGFERLALCFYSQFGCDLDLWPKRLKQILAI
jgi:hypothetical protein